MPKTKKITKRDAVAALKGDCPRGKVKNPATGNCVKAKGSIGAKIVNEYMNEEDVMRSRKDEGVISIRKMLESGKMKGVDFCGKSKVYAKDTGRCINAGGKAAIDRLGSGQLARGDTARVRKAAKKKASSPPSRTTKSTRKAKPAAAPSSSAANDSESDDDLPLVDLGDLTSDDSGSDSSSSDSDSSDDSNSDSSSGSDSDSDGSDSDDDDSSDSDSDASSASYPWAPSSPPRALDDDSDSDVSGDATSDSDDGSDSDSDSD